MLLWDLTSSPLQPSQVLPWTTKFPPLPVGLLRSLQRELGFSRRHELFGNCVPFAPTTSAQSARPFNHRENFSTFGLGILVSSRWSRYRRARAPGACVSDETTTRRDFPRKPAKKSCVAQPVVHALDRASIIVAYEEVLVHTVRSGRGSLASVRGERLHFCWFDDTVDVLLLPLDELASLPQADEPWTPNGPVGPQDTSLIAVWWLLREIETAAIVRDDVSIDTVRRRDTLLLPCRNRICKGRVHNTSTVCSCVASSDLASLIHAALREQDRVVALAAKLHIPSALMPLFPSESGAVCTKATMVAIIKAFAVRLQIPTVGHLGNRLFCRQLARLGHPSHGSCWRS